MSQHLRLSIVIPLHNEQGNLPELLRRLRAATGSMDGCTFQFVLVDDGSADRTWDLLQSEAAVDPSLLAIGLSRNFGHQAALTAGIDHASGDAVIVMDGDLQDDPDAIPDFVSKYREGFDVVYAQRVRRKEPWWLRLSYKIFYRMMASLSDINLPLDAGDFGLMSRRVVDELRRMPEHHRYLRGLRSWVGFSQVGIPVERAARHSGRSQYGIIGLLRLASDAIFAFSTIPIRAAALLGAVAVAISFLFALWAIIGKLFLNRQPQGFATVVVLITFLSGVLLFFLGVIGEYVGRIYEETKRRPLYLVARTAGRQDAEKPLPAAAIRAEPREAPSGHHK